MVKNSFPEEGEIVLCTVSKILGPTVFVHLDEYGRTGVIATSEIAPGRIRNLRDYVTINKKIACKVLRLDREKGHIDLSLRRVSQKDTKEILEIYGKEKTAFHIIEIVLKERTQGVTEKIKEKYSLFEFLEKAKTDEKLLSDYFSKEDAVQILNLIKERIKEKKVEVKKMILISSSASNGITLIKQALMSAKNVKISYIGTPNYSITAESNNPKDAEKKLKTAIDVIAANAKASGVKFEFKED